MANNYRDISDKTITEAKVVNHSLIEKALAMRCNSYLSQIKAQLLTDTIFEIDSTKKRLFNINTKLQKEINEHKKTEEKLKKAKEEAEEATKLKDKFVALVSHDLKSPLSVIKGYLDLLQMTQNLPPKANEMVHKGYLACESMRVLIENILSMSRISGGKICTECTLIDMEFLISRIVVDNMMMSDKKGVALINEVPQNTPIYADEELLFEAVSNLISNSIKFCSKGDTIKVYVPHGETSTIAVSDTGAGIKADAIKNLFLYEEKTSTIGTSGEMGTGFGLPLTHDIIAAHKGRLDVESTPGVGTTFYIRLPSHME